MWAVLPKPSLLADATSIKILCAGQFLVRLISILGSLFIEKLYDKSQCPAYRTSWHVYTAKIQISVASMQSEQSYSFPPEETLNPWLTKRAPIED